MHSTTTGRISQMLSIPRVMELLLVKAFLVVSPLPMAVDNLVESHPIGAQLTMGRISSGRCYLP